MAARRTGEARPVPPELRERLEANLGRRRRGIARPARWLLAVGAAAAVATVVGLLGPGNGRTGGGALGGQVAAGTSSVSAGALHRAGVRAPTPQKAAVHRSAVAPRARTAGTAAHPSTGVPGASRGRGAATGGRPKSTGGQAPAAAAAPAPFGAASSIGPARAARVVPPEGPAAGANTVVVEGSDLGQVRQVLFGGAPAPSIRHVSASRLAVVVPPHAPGTVTVRLVAGSTRVPSGAALHYSYR